MEIRLKFSENSQDCCLHRCMGMMHEKIVKSRHLDLLKDCGEELYSRTIKFSYHDARIKAFGHNNASPSRI